MSALFRKLLRIFREQKDAHGTAEPQVLLTPERITERLEHQTARQKRDGSTSVSETKLLRPVIDDHATVESILVTAKSGMLGEGARKSEDDLKLEVMDSDLQLTEIGADTDTYGPSPIIALERESSPNEPRVVASTIDEDSTPPVSAPAIAQQSTPTRSAAGLSDAEIENFDTFIHRQFNGGVPDPAPEKRDVLKILRLDGGDPSRTALHDPAPAANSVVVTCSSGSEDSATTASEINAASEDIVAEHPGSYDEAHNKLSWRDVTVSELMLEKDCSVRLSNCLAAYQDFFSDWTVGRALDNRSKFSTELMNVRNLGRKTAKEVMDVLDSLALHATNKDDEAIVADPLFGFVPDKLNSPLSEVLRTRQLSARLSNILLCGGLDGISVRDFVLDPDVVKIKLRGRKNAGRKTVDEATEILACYVEKLGQPDIECDAPPESDEEASDQISAGEKVRQEVASLSPKHVEVLQSRYGLNGEAPQTLQGIAERVHVTRERVRQVGAKALRDLRDNNRSRIAFSRYLVEQKEAQWTILFGSQSLLPINEISSRLRLLDPWFILAIDIVFKDGIDAYLEATAHRAANGWHRSPEEAENRQKLDDFLGGLLRTYQTPLPLETLEELAPSVASHLSDAGDRWTIHDGYIFTGYVGAKARRAARMHLIARRISEPGIFDIATLIAEYREKYPDDDCGSRMFEMQANETPHLFSLLFDNIWLCLDYTFQQVDSLPAPPFCRRKVEERQFAEGSMGDLLIKRLAEVGPQRMIDLRREIVDNGQGSFSASSVGVVLISNPCFQRVAPGIFGLHTGTSEVSATLDAHLLDDRHCRQYCHARHSGAPSSYYPAWGPAYEMLLSNWARRHAPPDLYRSLMAVIEPRSWPAAPEIIAEFETFRRRDGRFQISASQRPTFGHRFLDSAQFFAVLTHLVAFGWIGWFAVNRVTGTISSNQHAADVLAFLVMVGLVEPASDWQAPHHPTELAKRMFLEARRERHLHGNKLSGNEDAFGRLVSALYEMPPVASRGWVDVDEFTAAMPAWCTEGISTGKAFGGAQIRQPDINAEEFFESDSWDAVFGE